MRISEGMSPKHAFSLSLSVYIFLKISSSLSLFPIQRYNAICVTMMEGKKMKY
jgi:hypothetical protein